MEVPSPIGGVVQELKVKLGDKVSEGTLILTLSTGVAAPAPAAAAAGTRSCSCRPCGGSCSCEPPAGGAIDEAAFALAYASPSVRKVARELRIDLGKVKGTGDKGRILKQDVEAFAKGAPAAAAAPQRPQRAPA